jgi:hypothetical protein
VSQAGAGSLPEGEKREGEMADYDSLASTPRLQYYLALMEDTTKLSDRRQTTNDLFVGLNVVFFTGMGALFYASHLKSWWVTGLFAAITALAFFLNFTWIRLINRYSRLVGLRIRYMHQLESALQSEGIFVSDPPLPGAPVQPGSVPSMGTGVYTLEFQRIYTKDGHFGFSRLERGLIVIFMIAYVLATLGVATVTYLISTNVIGSVAL